MNLYQITLFIGLPIMLNFVSSKKLDTLEPLRAVSNSIHKFSNDFYQINAEYETGNFVSSPLSLDIVLAMTGCGARGNTEKQIQNSLQLPKNGEVVKNGFHALIGAFENRKKVTLQLAQKVYTDESLPLKSTFKNTVRDYFQSPVESLDFTRTDEASTVINNWVANQTNNYIKKIINPDDLQDAALVLLNTIYFRGNWTLPFPLSNTRTDKFYINENTTKNVTMMNREGWYIYGHLSELDTIYFILRNQNDNEKEAISMIVFLPKKINGLKKVQRLLRYVNLEKLHNQFQRSKLNLTMPRFKIESKPELQPVLERMGMTDMFTDVADFTGITDVPLKVSKVVQKAIIEVTEYGSTASAATALIPMFRSTNILEETITVKVDHPFVFLIYDGATNTVLFQGHVIDP